jgi:hypothetical protein
MPQISRPPALNVEDVVDRELETNRMAPQNHGPPLVLRRPRSMHDVNLLVTSYRYTVGAAAA